jgi:hypothetical protein
MAQATCWPTAASRERRTSPIRLAATWENGDPQSASPPLADTERVISRSVAVEHAYAWRRRRPRTVVDQAFVRTPNFAPDGPRRSAQTQLRTAVICHLLARRKPGVQIPSPPRPARTLMPPHASSSGCAAQRTRTPYCATAPAMHALLSSDDFGSSVERTATLHSLWRRVREQSWRQRWPCGAIGGRTGCTVSTGREEWSSCALRLIALVLAAEPRRVGRWADTMTPLPVLTSE